MKKQYAQDLKNKRNKLITDLTNTEDTIIKRFNLILSDYTNHMSDEHKTFCINNSINDLSFEHMLDIMIQTEINYTGNMGNQLNLF